ncbi:MAG: hypothetical protein Q7T80_15725 [Methanoregula sp.]|nr:hypothetical protein [Methanoregula sp.]
MKPAHHLLSAERTPEEHLAGPMRTDEMVADITTSMKRHFWQR